MDEPFTLKGDEVISIWLLLYTTNRTSYEVQIFINTVKNGSPLYDANYQRQGLQTVINTIPEVRTIFTYLLHRAESFLRS